MTRVRNLIFVLGDQLDPTAAAFDDAEPDSDVVIMAEVDAEVKRYPNHVQRVVLFFTAMRHFRDALREQGYKVIYRQIDDETETESLICFLQEQIRALRPERVVMTEPGRYELERACLDMARAEGIPLEVRPDKHFFCSRYDFKEWASGRKTLVLEHFYRKMRRRYGYLMRGDKPVGDAWNFDSDNRAAFGRDGPHIERSPLGFKPDAVTREVIDVVQQRYPELPGSVDDFDWPATPEDARRAVDDFVKYRLPRFGRYQDAMWTDQPYLFHARLSTALNLKLVNPRVVVEKAVEAYEAGDAPISAVEGFVRQVLGWREFMRGVYWLHMPGYDTRNELEANRDLPSFFWTGETEMHCVRQVVQQLLKHGYAHHIQRLMVTGLFTLLYGAKPRQVHDWYMAMFVDSVEWVTLPNTIGMSQYADGGVVGTKPYVASGKYIKRMSNYCDACSYNPDSATGEKACPFTTLYWSFLMTHEVSTRQSRTRLFDRAGLDESRQTNPNQAVLGGILCAWWSATSATQRHLRRGTACCRCSTCRPI
jgi:deoxyribodipyrimidine photolyase-related protein